MHLPLATRGATPDSWPPASGPITACAQLPIVTVNPRMLELHRAVAKLGPKRMPVLITGETGTGKEVLVHALHAHSNRCGPLNAVNCGAIPRALTEAMLFGHERGAFTGADRRSCGVFEDADRGTLFLDEVGELSLETQAALLRVLQVGRITRLGSNRELAVDVRIVAATHQDLSQRVREGTFREDLFYRINTVSLCVPPLRERPDEIEPLALHFMRVAAAEQDAPVRALSNEALARLRAHCWPGNVRELRSTIERSVAFCEHAVIGPGDLPEVFATQRPLERSPQARSASEASAVASDDCADGSFRQRVRAYEVRLIAAALQRADGNVTKAAKLLRIPIRTLTHKLRAYGLRRNSEPLPY